MKTQLVGALVTVWANLALTNAFYGARDDVLELSPQNFGGAILDTDVKLKLYIYMLTRVLINLTIAIGRS